MNPYEQQDAGRVAAHLLGEAIDLVERALKMDGLVRGPATVAMGDAFVALMAAEGILSGRHQAEDDEPDDPDEEDVKDAIDLAPGDLVFLSGEWRRIDAVVVVPGDRIEVVVDDENGDPRYCACLTPDEPIRVRP